MEKKVIVWKIHDKFSNFTKEKEISHPYSNNSGIPSQFSRLDWSPDGQLIGTNSGSVKGIFTSPLIRRGDGWKVEGHLKGHRKNVNICRFSPSLKKEITESEGRETLSCSSYLATAGGDGNVVIWKTGADHPFFILRRASEAGISDLTWGLNGNILLASSVDGEICMTYFHPKTLGDFCNTTEEQDIFFANYGEIVALEYKRNSQFIVKSLSDIRRNVVSGKQDKQITTISSKTGKKRIIPISEETIITELDPKEFRFKFADFPSSYKEEGTMEQLDNAKPSANSGSPMRSEMSQEEASIDTTSPCKTDLASEDANTSIEQADQI